MIETPCPHCDELLFLSTSIAEGEQARCGHCYAPTVYEGGELRPLPAPAPALTLGEEA